MEILKFFIPVIASIIALLSLFTDPKEVKKVSDIFKKPKILSLVILIIFSLGANIAYTHFESVKYEKEIAQKNSRIEELLKTTKDTNVEIKNISYMLKGFGVKNPEQLSRVQKEEILQANNLRTKVIKNSINNLRRGEILIQYFPKGVDGEKVFSALKELNFQVSEGNPKYPNGETNALYYGDNVDMESIKLVALTLLRAGVKIEGIFQFANSNGRENLIQVVHSGKVTKSTKLKAEEIIGINLN